jgi:hypothetical protein
MGWESCGEAKISKDQVEDILKNELKVEMKDIPKMVSLMSLDEARSVLKCFELKFGSEDSPGSQHPLVSDLMKLLEKSGNVMIQKSELKEALRQLSKKTNDEI